MQGLRPQSLALSDLYARLAPIVVAESDPRSSFSNWAQTFTCNPLTGEWWRLGFLDMTGWIGGTQRPIGGNALCHI